MTRIRLTSTVLPIVTLALLVGCSPGGTAGSAGQGTPSATPGEPSGFVEVTQRLEPSVVTIRTDTGLGSGVVWKAGTLVTNAHVVGNQHMVTVVYADGTRSGGTVLAADTVTDVAIVRTDRTNLPVPQFRMELPVPGERALAIGSPLGFQNSVTAGIISGLHREIPGSASQTRSLVDLIQTDASISPGNSGGALLDAQGRIVGINEAYIPPSAGAVSLGFAIPSATAVDVAGQLLDHGSATHPYLGVSVGQLTSAIRERLGVQTDHGALVLGVDQGGPAASAGMRPGDVIVELAGKQVRDVEDLLAALRQTKPGQQVPATVVRGSARTRLTVTIGAQKG